MKARASRAPTPARTLPRPRFHRRSTPTASRRFAADLRATAWDEIEARQRPEPRATSTRWPAPMSSSKRDDRQLRHGRHPARAGHARTCSRSPTCCCCAAISASPAPASARCAAIPTCRATAPSASPKSPIAGAARQRGEGVRLPPAAAVTATTRSRRCRRWWRARSKVLVCLGGNLAIALPDPDA